MKTMRVLHLLAVLTVLLGSAGVFPLSTAAQTIHALLIIDDANPTSAPQHNSDKDRMERLFRDIKHRAGIPYELSELRSNVHWDSPERMSRENILKWTQEVNADRDDIVFVYFSGHGGVNRSTKEFYLTLPGEIFNRKVLSDTIDRIPCRLKLFLTDATNLALPIALRDEFLSHKKAYANLFLEHKGFLNVAAAVEGEYALGNAEGGIFTRAFVGLMVFVDKLDDDGFVSWEEVFEATKQMTHAYFEWLLASPTMPESIRDALTEIGQQSQRPKYFGELPQRITRDE